MTALKIFNLTGLLLDIIGAWLMFRNTPHPTRKPQGNSGMDVMRQGAYWLFKGKALEKKELRNIKIGMGLLIVGFSFQFITSLVDIIN